MAGQHYSPAMLALFARRAKSNHNAMFAFVGTVCGLAAGVMLFNLIRTLALRVPSTSTQLKRPSLPVRLGRSIRRVALRKAPAVPSVGHAVVIGLYFAINIALVFGPIEYGIFKPLSSIASRAGWMAIANIVLLIFLALKNTPLAYISPWSYERLSILHQYAGYTTLLFVIIHVSCYSAYFVHDGRPSRLLWKNDIYGMVAGLSVLALGITGGIVRRFNYELFYVCHVGFWILTVIMVGLHQPEFSKKIIIATCIAGAMWGLDRLIRFIRLLAYSTNNTAVLTPLPNGATKISLKKAPLGAISGKHCFLWIPRIKAFQTHPFTISSIDPAEFVIGSYDGFTADLHKYALKHPGVELKASVEGPYGTFPDLATRDKLVLIAGGSGATFIFGMALHMLKLMSPDQNKSITFVWIIRDQSYLTWFSKSLKVLSRDSRVSIQIYVTRPDNGPQTTPTYSLADLDDTKAPKFGIQSEHTLKEALSTSFQTDVEKVTSSSSESDTAHPAIKEILESNSTDDVHIINGRPDIETLVRTEVDATPSHQRVLVMGCGPSTLMTDVRNVTASCIRSNGPSVELHCEQFGW